MAREERRAGPGRYGEIDELQAWLLEDELRLLGLPEAFPTVVLRERWRFREAVLDGAARGW